MKCALAIALLVAASPVGAQIVDRPTTDDPDPTEQQAPRTRPQSLRSAAQGRGTARSAYGYRLNAPEEDEDETDRRVLRRLNTRLNNRLETRIERYRFVDTKSDRTGLSTRNPYAPPLADTSKTQPVVRKRPVEDPR